MHAGTSLSSTSNLGRVATVAWPIVLSGGLAVAATDFVYCVLFWSPQGVAPMKLLQSIAAGALGRAAFHGGIATTLLGAGFQWLIGCSYVLAYAMVAPYMAPLRRHPQRYGIAYGLLLYLVMNGIVVPLSAAPRSAHPQIVWMLASVPMFAVFGTIAARFALRALADPDGRTRDE